MPGKDLSDCHIQPIVKHISGNIMVWGCMDWEGVRNLYCIKGIMNTQVYFDILISHLLDAIDRQSF